MITVELYPPLDRLVGSKQIDIELETATVEALLQWLADRYPQLHGELAGERSARRYLIFVNGVDVRRRLGRNTPISTDDRIVILAPMGGGANPA